MRRGLCETTENAREAVRRGDVRVAGAPVSNVARLVAPHESVAVMAPPPRFVSRGGDKLRAALTRFELDLTGLRVLDAGASTGGFTDCALQAGAATVVAVDVGRGQLHERLRRDPRVEVHERTNIREVAPGDLGRPADVVVADLSFIGLSRVAPVLVSLGTSDAQLLWLVKPQFEAERHEADAHRGVIADPQIWSRVLGEVCATMEDLGTAIMGVMTSPLRGAEGNVEFLVHGRRTGEVDAQDRSSGRTDAMIEAAVTEARAMVEGP